MISLKYWIILGAILIIGIYFAYKGTKEGLTEFSSITHM